MKRPIIASVLTAGVLAATAFAGATSADAGSHTAATINNFLNGAWYNARNTGTLAPLSNSAIVTYGDTWCYDKGRYGSATAYRLLDGRIGQPKGSAIGLSADTWFC
jgi:hypothetical protein